MSMSCQGYVFKSNTAIFSNIWIEWNFEKSLRLCFSDASPVCKTLSTDRWGAGSRMGKCRYLSKMVGGGGLEEPVVEAGCLPPPQSFSPKWPPAQCGSNSTNSWDLSPAAPIGVISCDLLLSVIPLLILPSSVNIHPASHPLFSFLLSRSKLKSLIRKDWILLPWILNLGCLKEGPACHALIRQSFLKCDWFRKGSNPAPEPQMTDPAVDTPTLIPLTRKKKKEAAATSSHSLYWNFLTQRENFWEVTWQSGGTHHPVTGYRIREGNYSSKAKLALSFHSYFFSL